MSLHDCGLTPELSRTARDETQTAVPPRSGFGSNELLAAELQVILKIIYWILRLFAWPWAVRSVERWPAAPRLTAGRQQHRMSRKAPRAKGARMGYTAEVDSRCGWPASVGHPLSS